MSLHGDNSANARLFMSVSDDGGVDNGAYTVASLWCPDFFGGSSLQWAFIRSDNFGQRNGYFDGDMYAGFIQFDVNEPNVGNPPQWYWLVWTMPDGTAAPRAHFCHYSDLVWSHYAPLSGTHGPHGVMTKYTIGDEFGSAARGNFAVNTVFNYEMTDAEVEATFAKNSVDIMAANPHMFQHWPEADGVQFVDLVGNSSYLGGTGTWGVSADPTDFDFALTPARTGRPKIWNGSAWVNAPLKVWNGSAWVEHSVKGHDGTDWVLSK